MVVSAIAATAVGIEWSPPPLSLLKAWVDPDLARFDPLCRSPF